MSVPTFRDYDITPTVYKDPVKNKNGGLNLYCDQSATNKRNPKFQLAQCRAPFGVSMIGHDGQPVEGRKNMELSLDDPELLAFVQAWDKQNVEVAAQNSEKWFNKKLSAQSLEETLYRHCAQPHKEGKYAPTLRVKVVPPGSKNATKIYIVETGEDGQETYRPGTMEEVTRNSMVTPIVEFSGLWFVARGFGAAWVATDLLVWPADAPQKQFPFSMPEGSSIKRADDVPSAKRQKITTTTTAYDGGAAAGNTDYTDYGGAATGGFE